jgi:hypothetical protein
MAVGWRGGKMCVAFYRPEMFFFGSLTPSEVVWDWLTCVKVDSGGSIGNFPGGVFLGRFFKNGMGGRGGLCSLCNSSLCIRTNVVFALSIRFFQRMLAFVFRFPPRVGWLAGELKVARVSAPFSECSLDGIVVQPVLGGSIEGVVWVPSGLSIPKGNDGLNRRADRGIPVVTAKIFGPMTGTFIDPKAQVRGVLFIARGPSDLLLNCPSSHSVPIDQTVEQGCCTVIPSADGF